LLQRVAARAVVDAIQLVRQVASVVSVVEQLAQPVVRRAAPRPSQLEVYLAPRVVVVRAVLVAFVPVKPVAHWMVAMAPTDVQAAGVLLAQLAVEVEWPEEVS
jgi:hypothetical protein